MNQVTERHSRSVIERLYGVCALAVFCSLALPVTAVVAFVPDLSRRRRIARRAARLAFALTGIRMHTRGLEHLADKPCIVVANHASYLDGIVLTAALPPDFCFVIKREVTRVPLMHLLLRRLGSEFVERHDRKRGTIDARRLLRRASAGRALVFFPEGTFRRQPGLGGFRAGAFAAATRAQLPLVPVVIHGTRSILPAGARLPRRGPINVTVLAPIGAPDATTATSLRKATRRAMLAELGETDLSRVGHEGEIERGQDHATTDA